MEKALMNWCYVLTTMLFWNPRKNNEKGIIETIPCFDNNMFLKSNKTVPLIAQINIQKPISHFTNNTTIFGNNSVGPSSKNVGPTFPFHPLHLIVYHFAWVALKVQKIGKLTNNLIFSKMKGGVNKEEVERLSHLERDWQKVVLEQNKEEEGTKMETKSENKRRRKNVSFSNGGRLMFS